MPDVATEQVRSFNRTVTQRIGVLQDEYLNRGRPLGASRVLWKIGERGSDLRSLRDPVPRNVQYALMPPEANACVYSSAI